MDRVLTGETLKRISDHWAVVGAAYVLTFGVWTGAIGNDFISFHRRSLRSTRWRGLIHLCATAGPMAYMIVYIALQWIGGDFKEMWTAIIALLFAHLHVLRTFCGLWQLHCLKQWLVRSIKCMESLGYFASNCKGENCVDECPRKNHKSKNGLCPEDRGTPDERINKKADQVLVNDTLVDNRLFEGDVQCYLRLLSHDQRSFCNRNTRPKWVNMFLTFLFSALNFVQLPCVLWIVVRSRTPAYADASGSIYLEPRAPEELWLRWACTLVAEVFPEWANDMERAHVGSKADTKEDFSTRRAQFARELLLSAAMHTQCADSERASLGSNAEISFCTCESRSTHRFLQFKLWHKFPKLCQGQFSKQEFLTYACSTGAGLPFGIAHEKAVHVINSAVSRKRVYSYLKFAAKLQRAREALPADIGERIGNFGIEDLEWLTVILSIPDWCPVERLSHEKRIEKRGTSDSSRSSIRSEGTAASDQNACTLSRCASYENQNERTAVESDSKEQIEDSGFASENLKAQLGLNDSIEGLVAIERMNCFPLLRGCLSQTAWGNRNLLEISVHIDNTLALCCGDQISQLLQHIPELSTKCPWKTRGPPSSESHTQAPQTTCSGSRKTFDAQVELINTSLMNQLSLPFESEYGHMEQSITFLGCSMEGLRSSLATWVLHHPNADESVWTPEIASSYALTERGKENCCRFQVSDDFASSLVALRDTKYSQEGRFIQMRLMWELQSFLHSRLPLDGISPEKYEAMILCVLSFPALVVDVKCEDSIAVISSHDHCKVSTDTDARGKCFIEWCGAPLSSCESPSSRRRLVFTVRALCGPQDIHVEVVLLQKERGRWNARSSLVTGNEEDANVFEWEAWRDAFCGRLEGMGLWQERHQLPSMPLLRSWCKISAGVHTVATKETGTGEIMNVWLGWMPHRACVALFELMTEGYILRQKKSAYTLQDDYFFDLFYVTGMLKENRTPVAYRKASGWELQRSSVVAHEVLNKVYQERPENTVDLHLSGSAILAKSKEMLQRNNQKRLGILLIEAIACKLADFSAVKAAVKLLVCNGASSANIHRALVLLQVFCSYASQCKKDDGGQLGNARLYFADGKLASEVKQLLELVLKETGFNPIVAVSYTRICTSLLNYEDDLVKSALCVALRSSIIQSTFEDVSVLGQTRRILASVLPGESEEQIAVNCRLLFGQSLDSTPHEKIRNAAAKLLVGGDVAQNPSFSVKLLEYVVKKSNSIEAMFELGIILANGAEGVPADAPRAMQLYSQAAEKNFAPAMHALGALLSTGAEGLPANRSRAIEILTRTINITRNVYSMITLANILIRGSEDRDAPRAVKLYNRAINEGKNVIAMNQLGNLLKNGAECVPPNPPRAVKLFKRAITEFNEAWSSRRYC